MTDKHIMISRIAFAIATAVAMVVTFYFPLVGLGYALDSSADLASRGRGLLWVLPSLAGLIVLFTMLPAVRGRLLLWLVAGGSLLLLPSIAACAWLGFPAAAGAAVGCAYLAIWWLLMRPKHAEG